MKDTQVISGSLPEKKEKAKKKQKDSLLRDLTASLVIEGNPTITADNVIQVKGVAGVHVGKWFVDKVTHSITKSGFITTLELRKNATQKPNTAFNQSANPTIEQKMQKQNNVTPKKEIPKYNQYEKVVK
jgi:polysaccharide pyruvyl transferase WcaK-like protein